MNDDNIPDLLALIALLYDFDAALELREMAVDDPEGARELAVAALSHEALVMKHQIDASERKARANEWHERHG